MNFGGLSMSHGPLSMRFWYVLVEITERTRFVAGFGLAPDMFKSLVAKYGEVRKKKYSRRQSQ